MTWRTTFSCKTTCSRDKCFFNWLSRAVETDTTKTSSVYASVLTKETITASWCAGWKPCFKTGNFLSSATILCIATLKDKIIGRSRSRIVYGKGTCVTVNSLHNHGRTSLDRTGCGSSGIKLHAYFNVGDLIRLEHCERSARNAYLAKRTRAISIHRNRKRSSKRLNSAVNLKSCILQERIRCALSSLNGFAGDASERIVFNTGKNESCKLSCSVQTLTGCEVSRASVCDTILNWDRHVLTAKPLILRHEGEQWVVLVNHVFDGQGLIVLLERLGDVVEI